MARATVIVQKWFFSVEWRYYKGYPSTDENLALHRARLMERDGTRVRVYRRTPEGPKVIYESPKED